jgi:hypothetical protein
MTAASAPVCPHCGSALIRRSRARLLLVGLLLAAAPVAAAFLAPLWLPAIVALLAGAYLVVWATLGKGMWCRQCKSFPARP